MKRARAQEHYLSVEPPSLQLWPALLGHLPDGHMDHTGFLHHPAGCVESWGFADQGAAMVVPHTHANPVSTSPKVSAGRAALAIVTASPKELHALQGSAKPFLGCSVQLMQTAKLLAWTWTGAGKSHSLHLKFYCEIRLCLDMQGLAQAEVCIL